MVGAKGFNSGFRWRGHIVVWHVLVAKPVDVNGVATFVPVLLLVHERQMAALAV
jgi:hypothetical protein